jgi:hypothetical protein
LETHSLLWFCKEFSVDFSIPVKNDIGLWIAVNLGCHTDGEDIPIVEHKVFSLYLCSLQFVLSLLMRGTENLKSPKGSLMEVIRTQAGTHEDTETSGRKDSNCSGGYTLISVTTTDGI